MEGAEVAVSLRRDRALSEYHLLSEAAVGLTSKRNLEGNLPCKSVLSVSSARLASHLSPSGTKRACRN